MSTASIQDQDNLTFGVAVDVKHFFKDTEPYELRRAASEDSSPVDGGTKDAKKPNFLFSQRTELQLNVINEEETKMSSDLKDADETELKTTDFRKGQVISFKAEGKWVTAKVKYIGSTAKYIKIEYENGKGSQVEEQINECEYGEKIRLNLHEFVHDNMKKLDELALKMKELSTKFDNRLDDVSKPEQPDNPVIQDFGIDINREINDLKDWLENVCKMGHI